MDSLLAKARAPGLQPRAGGANSKLRVLVVEDDRLLQGIYRESFAACENPFAQTRMQPLLQARMPLGPFRLPERP